MTVMTVLGEAAMAMKVDGVVEGEEVMVAEVVAEAEDSEAEVGVASGETGNHLCSSMVWRDWAAFMAHGKNLCHTGYLANETSV